MVFAHLRMSTLPFTEGFGLHYVLVDPLETMHLNTDNKLVACVIIM